MLDKLLRFGEGRMVKRLKRVADYVNTLSDDVEKLSGPPAHRAFDGDRADSARDPARFSASELGAYLSEGEAGAAGRERDEVEAAQFLRPVSCIAVEVAFGLYQYSPATGSGEEAHGEMVGERARGQEQRRFLTEKRHRVKDVAR